MKSRVWVTFRHSQIFPLGVATVVDKLAEWITGGPEVHCEFVVETDGTLTTYGALFGIGVFSSTVRQDASYRTGKWTWVDVTSLFSATESEVYLREWLEHTLGLAYGTRAMVAFAVPWTGAGHRKLPKDTYICSELVADALLNCSATTAPTQQARKKILSQCRADTSRLSPYQIYTALRACAACRELGAEETERLSV